MTKKEAADSLGVSTRAVERYVSQNKLTVKYEKGKTNKVAVFNSAEVGALKAEMESATYKPSIVTDQSTALAPAAPSPVMLEKIVGDVAIRVAEAITAQQRERAGALVPIEVKLTLSLKEAAALSGLAAGYLREEIKAGKLKASKARTRGWNIKRADLDEYVKKLR